MLSILISSTKDSNSLSTISLTLCSCPGAPATLQISANNTIFIINSCDAYIWRGSTYNSSGLYYDTLVNQLGCDSILTLALTINDSVVVQNNVNACDSYAWNGIVYTQSGNYTWQGSTIHGCDSIMYLNLSLSQNTSSSSSQTVCDSITWNNSFYTTSGNYDYTTLNSNGCDSTITLILTAVFSKISSTTSFPFFASRIAEVAHA